VTIKWCNILLGNVNHSKKSHRIFWEDELPAFLESKFGFSILTPKEKSLPAETFISEVVDFRIIFSFLFRLLGIKLRGKSAQQLMDNPRDFKFAESDILSIEASHRHVSLVYFSSAMYHLVKARQVLRKYGISTEMRRKEVLRETEIVEAIEKKSIGRVKKNRSLFYY
jgi:hypothetical protein